MVCPGLSISARRQKPDARPPRRFAPPPCLQPRTQSGIIQGQHGHRQQSGIDGPCLADRQRADRNARGHLHNRQQAVLTGKSLGFHRNAEHRQVGHGRGHAGQMGRAPCSGNHHLKALGSSTLGKAVEPFGRAMGRNDPRLVRHSQCLQCLGGMLHGRPVGLAPHDDGNRLIGSGHGRIDP